MHDPTAQGSDFFKCDFCRAPWADDRPMVEGHRGSLICARCLTVAFDEVVNRKGGEPLPEGTTCVLCLSRPEGAAWRSPALDVWACARCIRQSAGVLAKDKESEWTRPGSA